MLICFWSKDFHLFDGLCSCTLVLTSCCRIPREISLWHQGGGSRGLCWAALLACQGGWVGDARRSRLLCVSSGTWQSCWCWQVNTLLWPCHTGDRPPTHWETHRDLFLWWLLVLSSPCVLQRCQALWQFIRKANSYCLLSKPELKEAQFSP